MLAVLSIIFFIISAKQYWTIHSRIRASEKLNKALKEAEENLRKELGDTVDLKPTMWTPPKESGFVLLYEQTNDHNKSNKHSTADS